jgi:hypothetical protein
MALWHELYFKYQQQQNEVHPLLKSLQWGLAYTINHRGILMLFPHYPTMCSPENTGSLLQSRIQGDLNCSLDLNLHNASKNPRCGLVGLVVNEADMVIISSIKNIQHLILCGENIGLDTLKGGGVFERVCEVFIVRLSSKLWLTVMIINKSVEEKGAVSRSTILTGSNFAIAKAGRFKRRTNSKRFFSWYFLCKLS